MITLIRHGESRSNAGERTATPDHVLLTGKGYKQSVAVAGAIRHAPALIIHSPYRRTLESCRPLQEKFPNAKLEEWPLQEFTYLSPSKYPDTTRFERLEPKNSYWDCCDPDFRDGEGAESFAMFLQRISAGLASLQSLQENVLVVTHGHVIRAMLWRILVGSDKSQAGNMREYYHLREALVIPNACIIELELNERPARLSSFALDHLQGLDVEAGEA